MQKSKFFRRFFNIFIIIFIWLQTNIYADVAQPIDYYPNMNYPSPRSIVDALIDALQLYLLMILFIYIAFLLIYIIKKGVHLFIIKKSLNSKKPKKISFREEIKNDINNNITYNDAKSSLTCCSLLSIFFFIPFIYGMSIFSNFEPQTFGILSLLFILSVGYLFWMIRCLNKYMQSINEITKTVIYSKNDLQNKEYYLAKESLLNIKRIIPAISIIVFYNISALAIEFVKHFAVDKPIIYLYPTETTNVSVKLDNPDLITTSYPKYQNGWNVIAEPNGNLTEIETGKKLYALYWEGKNVKPASNFNSGWCVKGEDVANFLEEKLNLLGLNDREAEEFIIYWLPKLESNTYNLIRFKAKEEIDTYMPLTITPQPDSIIRVVMEFKGVKQYKELKPQEITTPERNGFVVVEWGGTEL